MKKRLLKSIRPAQLVLIGDQLLILFGFLSALMVNYRILSINTFPIHTIIYFSIIQIILGIIAWLGFGVYRKVIRFFNSRDYLNMILIVASIHVLNLILDVIFPTKHFLKPEIFLVSFFITSIYIVGSRFLINYLYFYYNNSKSIKAQKNILIYGAGELGVFIKKSINSTYHGEYKIVAFLDDDPLKINRYIGGIKVIDASKSIQELVNKNDIIEIIIANNSLNPLVKSSFLKSIIPLNIRIREMSSINSFFGVEFNLDKLSNIDINDLMNRAPINLFDEHIANKLKQKISMVTGAAGSIGSEIVRKLSIHKANKIICIDFSESALFELEQELKTKFPLIKFNFLLADIRNEHILDNIINEYRPDFIYHAAAYKHVPLMEQFPWEALKTNFFATLSLAKLAIKYKVEKFVFISSDKAINPTSVMGATKRLAELIIQACSIENHSTQFVTTRFGNVLGSNGSVVPLFKKQIQMGGPVTVTHPDMVRYFMTIGEACQLVLEASVIAEGGEIYIFDMGEPVKILDLAKNMIRLAGFRPDIDIKIEFIGERPGEKLYEELFSDEEKETTTRNEKILISKKSKIVNFDIVACIEKINSIEGSFDSNLYKSVIKEFVPEFSFVNKKLNTTNKIYDYSLNSAIIK